MAFGRPEPSFQLGLAFALNSETRQGGVLSVWSRGALALDGQVRTTRTTMFGANYAKGPLVAGLSLSRSRGLGSYAGGVVTSTVTGLHPWLGYHSTDRTEHANDVSLATLSSST